MTKPTKVYRYLTYTKIKPGKDCTRCGRRTTGRLAMETIGSRVDVNICPACAVMIHDALRGAYTQGYKARPESDLDFMESGSK